MLKHVLARCSDDWIILRSRALGEMRLLHLPTHDKAGARLSWQRRDHRFENDEALRAAPRRITPAMRLSRARSSSCSRNVEFDCPPANYRHLAQLQSVFE